MNPPELLRLAQTIGLDRDDRFGLRIVFGVACIERVEHCLTDSAVIDCLAVGKAFVAGECGAAALGEAAARASAGARSHPGSSSVDGAGSAAVSTSLGVAAALAGRALEAAEYSAYAAVYFYASHAVTDISAYEDEHRWQVDQLSQLLEDEQR